MAKAKPKSKDDPKEPAQVSDISIEEEMRESFMTFAMSVIIARALPDVRDGLKPAQRRILYAMHDLNLTPGAQHRKCAKIAGDTSGNYHPHGQEVVYPTLARLAQDWNMRYPLVDGHGNFGSVDGDPPAAMRYTEARLSEVGAEILEHMNLDTVDFVDNYDGTRQEPVVLPGRFPNLLANGASGIAVGMATSLPPHNLNELCDAIIKLIEEPEVTIPELMEILPGPDFPTGGIICGREGIRDGYSTGRGTITLRARTHFDETKGGPKQIIVTEVPFRTNRDRLVERIADAVQRGTISEISDIRNESDRTGTRIVIELKRGTDQNVVLNQLFQHTPLQSTFSIIMIAIVNGRPETLNIKQMLQAYIEHRIEVIERRTRHLLAKAQERAHILEGL
ncbi:MAG: DNA gyrase subunit A, partial [Phycisphaerae bacterium]|nr:DNA gyrase subunit A [Phycisphaerae bacterium]